jgi:hypothetical protein
MGYRPVPSTEGITSWGTIQGSLPQQIDLQAALDGKADLSHSHGDRTVVRTFDFSSPTPLAVTTAEAGEIVTHAYVEIITPFNAGTTLSIGDSGWAIRLMNLIQNDPTMPGVYGVIPMVRYEVATPIQLRLHGATQGSGRVMIRFHKE